MHSLCQTKPNFTYVPCNFNFSSSKKSKSDDWRKTEFSLNLGISGFQHKIQMLNSPEPYT